LPGLHPRCPPIALHATDKISPSFAGKPREVFVDLELSFPFLPFTSNPDEFARGKIVAPSTIALPGKKTEK
jgi:hypothetical protein